MKSNHSEPNLVVGTNLYKRPFSVLIDFEQEENRSLETASFKRKMKVQSFANNLIPLSKDNIGPRLASTKSQGLERCNLFSTEVIKQSAPSFSKWSALTTMDQLPSPDS